MDKILSFINKFKQKGDNMCEKQVDLYNNIYIPQIYKNSILRHLILNYASDINGYKPPLILSIQGEKGEGKSFMVQKLCEYYNIDVIILSGAELCGPNEGDALNVLKSKYETACSNSAIDKKFRAIIIDDFHLSIAGDFSDKISKTTNSHGLVGYLMNLCDNPIINGIRVPIIMTGNDFTKTYTALTRNGRMTFLKWAPNIEDKKRIVYYMFKKFYPYVLQSDTDKLVEKYSEKYIAFFKSVLQDIFFKNFDEILQSYHHNFDKVNYDNINDLIKEYIIVEDINLSNMILSAEKVQNDIACNYEKGEHNYE